MNFNTVLKKIYKVLRGKIGFTLLEILLVVAALAVLAAIVIVAINPTKQLAETRNSQRAADLRTIMDAISQYTIDHEGHLPPGITGALRMIGTDPTGGSVICINCVSQVETEAINRYANLDHHLSFVPEAMADGVSFKNPEISSAEVSPLKVVPGDLMTITVEVSDVDGVQSVVADMAGIESVELHLKEGDEFDGVWEGEWLVHDTKKQDYVTVVTATDTFGGATTKDILWSDPSEWISPNGYEDPNNQWTNETRGYDGNTTTYASNSGAVGWRGFIVYNLTTPINSDRIRLNVDYLNAHINEVDVDVHVDGAWVDVFQGGDQSTWNCQWVELSFPKGSVDSARFRYNYKVGGYQYWLYEFQFYETAAEIYLPTGNTLDASSVEETVAILHGEVTDDGGEPVEYRFQYGTTESYGTDTPWVSGKITGESFDQLITDLESGVNYHYRAQIRNSAGTFSGDDQNFFTSPGAIGWVSTTGYDDPDGVWENVPYAYDDSTISLARSYHNMNAAQWSSYVYFSRPQILSDKVMFYARAGSQVDSVDLDVYKDGAWIDVYQGGFADRTWVEKTFEEGIVTQARIRFHAANASEGFYWELNEMDFYKITETTTDECLDLGEGVLAPDYLTSIPYDPRYGSPEKTFYCVKINSSGRLILRACQPELSDDIYLER